MTTDEAAEQLHCSPRHVRRLFSRGELPGYRVGKLVRIYARSVERFRERHAVKAPSRHGL